MRTHLITLVATLGFSSFAVAAAAATAPGAGGAAASAASTGGSYSGGSGGGGSSGGGHSSGGHGSGGGHSSGGARSGSGHWNSGSAGHAGSGQAGRSYASASRAHANYASGSYIARGVNGARGGYGIVGYQSAGLDHGGATPRQEHSVRTALALGPLTGSAATAAHATDQFHPRTGPHTRPNGRYRYPKVAERFRPYADNCEKRACQAQLQGLWPAVCNPLDQGNPYEYNERFGCPQAIKVKAPLTPH